MELREEIAAVIYQALEVVRLRPIQEECAGGEPPIQWGLDTGDIKAIAKRLADQILTLIEQEYEPVELEPLADEEITMQLLKAYPNTCAGDLAPTEKAFIHSLIQATIAKNRAKGQLYRRKSS